MKRVMIHEAKEDFWYVRLVGQVIDVYETNRYQIATYMLVNTEWNRSLLRKYGLEEELNDLESDILGLSKQYTRPAPFNNEEAQSLLNLSL